MVEDVILYGISNCDTVKKARRWLEGQGVPHAFHDYRKIGVPAGLLEAWAAMAGWTALLNRAGTTFRKLPEPEREGLDEARAIALMRAHPALIKRPVVPRAGGLLIGFKPETYAAAFGGISGDTSGAA
ncbi:arsenate reductase [Roseomonas frigidaquae]|uniref:Arsenate reductase n=1 Tax=Falsiroseomonas frigidaquae TaxID=487318 RepID=A0ABX1F6H2_9PROT|nr:arsenate reductase [Falsiroseomonas frigidaquae]NKE47981.1 arsenate reductase [Falsiroseomonas frigidaquae]